MSNKEIVLIGTNAAAKLAGVSAPSIGPMFAKLGMQPLAQLKQGRKLVPLYMECQADTLRDRIHIEQLKTKSPRDVVFKCMADAARKAGKDFVKNQVMHQTPAIIC